VRASILIVGHPTPDTVEFGADHCAHYDSALEILKTDPYAVVVAADRLPKAKGAQVKESFEFLKETKFLNANVQTILVGSEMSPQELQRAINAVGVFKIIPEFEPDSLQLAVREALEEYELIKQNQAFLALTQEQNQRLQHLSVLLEDKVKARETFLVEAREKLLQATRRTEALNRALVAIQRSLTKQEIEQHLKDALHVALGLSWTRILFRDQIFLDQVEASSIVNMAIFSAPLWRDQDLLGHIYFARDSKKPFTPDEDDFLLQVSDAVGLAIDRLMALEAIESLKQEWDSTFDSVTDALSIVDENYQIVRVNKSYAKKAQTPLENIAGRKCHEVLFHRPKPCENCHLGQSFDLGEVVLPDGNQAHFSVSSHSVRLDGGKKAFALFYRDISEEQKIQRQILESSKMAEIGTIGSSIAHEINNPLGGMIAFLQILKGEIPKEDRIFPDIVEMELAAIRCKSIVENLLAFTRKSVTSELQPASLSELIRLVGNIMELQTRGLGIQIVKELKDPDTKIQVDANQLVQVLVNVMQNSCESIAERMAEGRRQPPGKISVRSSFTDEKKSHIKIEIVDNGVGIPTPDLARVFTPFFTTKDKTKNPGLGLSVSYQIVKEHGGQMEISSILGQSVTVLITLPVAKSPTGQQIFD
jgi:two-component system NtrC family sensor kinase